MKMPLIMVRAMKLAFDATEWADFIKILYDCLPAKIRATAHKDMVTTNDVKVFRPGLRYVSIKEKARMVYTHWRDIDLNKAIPKLILNHFSDKVIGLLNKKAGDFFKDADIIGYGNIF